MLTRVSGLKADAGVTAAMSVPITTTATAAMRFIYPSAFFRSAPPRSLYPQTLLGKHGATKLVRKHGNEGRAPLLRRLSALRAPARRLRELIGREGIDAQVELRRVA